MKTLYIALSIAVLAGSSACSPKLSPQQVKGITSVSVQKPTSTDRAYMIPSGGNDAARSKTRKLSVLGGVTGVIAGKLVGDAIHSRQDKAFKKSKGDLFNNIENATPDNLKQTVKLALTEQIKTNPFFGPKLISSAPYRFETEIFSHGIRRVGVNPSGDLDLSVVLKARIYLRDPNGKKLLSKKSVKATSKTRATINEYVNDTSLIMKAYDEAADQLAREYNKVLLKATKEADQ